MTSAILRATPTDALSHDLIDLIDLIADNTAVAVWFLQWVEQFRALDAAFTAHHPHDPPPPRDGGGPGLSGTDATTVAVGPAQKTPLISTTRRPARQARVRRYAPPGPP